LCMEQNYSLVCYCEKGIEDREAKLL
jgi:hypothetical protein